MVGEEAWGELPVLSNKYEHFDHYFFDLDHLLPEPLVISALLRADHLAEKSDIGSNLEVCSV